SKYNTVESNLQLVYQNFTQLSESLNSFINDLNIYNAYKITTDTVDAKIINNTIADNVFDNILPQIKTLTDDELRVSDILVNPKGIFHIYMFPNLTDTINYYSNTIRVPGNIVFSQGIYKPANINILFPTTPLAGKIGYNLATLAISKDDRKIGNHVKAVLNNYLYLRNYDLIIQLINAIDASADPKYNDIKNSALIDMGISADIKKYINYSTTVKITQDLLKNYYNYVSFQTAREILINAVGLPKVGSTYQLLSGVIPELVLFKNTPFSLDFTQLARTTVDYLKNIPMPHAFDIIQADTIIVDKATDVKAPEIKEIVMSNYRAGGVADKNCLHADKKVVQLLIDKNAMINIRDKNGNTPLYYAISLQQLDFIDLLVKNSAKIVNIKNNKFISPIEYAVDLYNNHNSILYASDLKTVIKRITDEDYNTFIKNIQTNADFKNNILKFAKNTLPQFNILYNNMLFYFTKQFNSKWSSANLADLTTLLKTAVNKQYADQLDKYYVDDVILADIDQKLPELIKYDTTYSLNDTVNVLEDEKKRINDKISKYNDELTKLQEINHAFHANTDVDAKAYGKEIHNKIRTVTAAITTLTTELTTKTADATNHSSNMTTTNTTTLAKLQTSLAAYKTAKTNGVYNIPDMNTNKTPVALYTYIANIVFNKSGYLYNKLWFDCISNEQQLTNMNNIHILLIQLQNKLLSDLKIRLAASIKSGILVKHNYIMDYKNFQIIDKWYNYIVDKCVKEPDSLPKYYDSQQNLVLYELTNNYVHVLFNTVTISFYNAIKKLVMRYVETITPQQTATLRGHLHTEYIVDTTNELMHNSGVKEYLIGDTSEVKNMVTQYASGKFTSAFVKSKLALKTDKNEVMTENTKDMFDKVKDMLIANKQIPITRESNVAQYYDKYISPYFNKTYDELYNLLAKEKLNYDYYIINNKNYNNIIVKLLEAITK
ncbi:MAG: ankyrin repeat protein, partial [Faunusvirus sp.]